MTPRTNERMDGEAFDDLIRRLGATRSRRAFVRGVLGGGLAATAGTLLGGKVDAARRPGVPPQSPGRCPSNQQGRGRNCACPSGTSKCGSDCCPDGVATCCDNACCYGHCSAEEVCCDTSNWCDAAGECCAPGQVCCGTLGCFDGLCPCEAESPETTCAGKCGSQTNNCGATVDCGPCSDTCSPGQQMTDNGCVDCSAGTYSSSGVACYGCAAGTFSAAGASSCTACPAGTYTPMDTSTGCLDCGCDTCDPVTGACATGNLADGLACTADSDCQSGQCGCNAPPGFPSCFCRHSTCLANGADCAGSDGAIACCEGDCTMYVSSQGTYSVCTGG